MSIAFWTPIFRPQSVICKKQKLFTVRFYLNWSGIYSFILMFERLTSMLYIFSMPRAKVLSSPLHFLFLNFHSRSHAIGSLDFGRRFSPQSPVEVCPDRVQLHWNDHLAVRGHDHAVEHHGSAAELGLHYTGSHWQAHAVGWKDEATSKWKWVPSGAT